MDRRRSCMLFASAAAFVLAVAVACNTGSFDRCASNADCPAGSTCDLFGRYCTKADAGREAAKAETGVDAEADASDADASPPSPCDLAAPFATFTLVAGFENREISAARLTPGETTVLFAASNGCAEETCADLFAADRPNRKAAFGSGRPLPVVNCGETSDYWPTISSDGMVLFFESSRAVDGGCANDLARVWSTTRNSVLSDFQTPTIQSLFAGQTASEAAPYLHPNARSLYFTSGARGGKGGFDIFVAKLNSLGLATSVENVEAVNSDREENMAVISLDDSALYFGRVGASGAERDVWLATRSSPSAAFTPATLVTELSSTSTDEYPSWISDDRCRLYFISNRPSGSDAAGIGAYRAWVAERPKAR